MYKMLNVTNDINPTNGRLLIYSSKKCLNLKLFLSTSPKEVTMS